jgi:hypothetical protein
LDLQNIFKYLQSLFVTSFFTQVMRNSQSIESFNFGLRSPPSVEETTSRVFEWKAMFGNLEMQCVKHSLAQVEKPPSNFQFITDMEAEFQSRHNNPAFKRAFAGSNSTSRKSSKKSSKKSRPRNSFILYRTVQLVKEQFKGKTQGELSALISACWENETPGTVWRFERAAELEKGTLYCWFLFTDTIVFGYGAANVFGILNEPQETHCEHRNEFDFDQYPLSNPFPMVDELNNLRSNLLGDYPNLQPHLYPAFAVSLSSHGVVTNRYYLPNSNHLYGEMKQNDVSHYSYNIGDPFFPEGSPFDTIPPVTVEPDSQTYGTGSYGRPDIQMSDFQYYPSQMSLPDDSRTSPSLSNLFHPHGGSALYFYSNSRPPFWQSAIPEHTGGFEL